MKKYFLAFSISAMSLFAEQVSVSLFDAVKINHELIKDLYLENKRLSDRISELEKATKTYKETKPTIQELVKDTPVKPTANKNLNKKGNHIVAYSYMNIRSAASIENSEIVSRVLSGEILSCDEGKQYVNWCKIGNKQYVSKKGLVKIKQQVALVTKDTSLYTHSSLEKVETIKKGTVISVLGLIDNKWYVLENNLLASKNDILLTSNKGK